MRFIKIPKAAQVDASSKLDDELQNAVKFMINAEQIVALVEHSDYLNIHLVNNEVITVPITIDEFLLSMGINREYSFTTLRGAA